MSALADQPAFPQAFLREFYDDGRPHTAVVTNEGMTLRQFYAGLAMQGFMASDKEQALPKDIIAGWSVECADALIAELSKPTTPQAP